MLHPAHKLEYFRAAGWEPAWIDEARRIVREEYDRSYGTDSLGEPPSNKVRNSFITYFLARSLNLAQENELSQYIRQLTFAHGTEIIAAA